MKKKITAIILSAILAFSLMPFSIVRAFTNIVEHSSGTFTNGAWITYYASNNNGYIVLDEFGIQNVNQFVQALVTKIDLNNYYDGVMEITLAGNISTNLWEYYLQGEGVYIISSDNTHVTVNLVNCQQFYLVACCGNDNDLNFRPSSINSLSLKISSGINVVVNSTYIQNFRFMINWDDPSSSSDRIDYRNTNLNSFSYFNNSLNSIAVNRLDAQFDYEIVDGNYVVTTWFYQSSVDYDNPFGNPIFITRDASGTNRHIEDYCYFSYYKSNKVSNKYVYSMTVYAPLSVVSATQSGYKYQFLFNAENNTKLQNVTMVGFIFRGVVENLPSEVQGNDVTNPSSDIQNTADELTDLHDQENQIVSDFHDNLTDFNTNMDLTGYDFITGLNNSNNYFKMLLDQMYVESSSIRAFWVIPLILVILTVLLGR